MSLEKDLERAENKLNESHNRQEFLCKDVEQLKKVARVASAESSEELVVIKKAISGKTREIDRLLSDRKKIERQIIRLRGKIKNEKR